MKQSDRTDILKKQLLKALEKSLGIVTTACKNVGIHRSTYYDWYNRDLQFKKEVDDINEVALDFGESKLFEQIADNIPSSTMFFLKCKGKKRGYVERQEIVNRVDIEQDLRQMSEAELFKALEELRHAVKN